MKKVKVVFQGDSITDAGRDKRNYHDLGKGYPKYAAEQMVKDHPDVEFEFINFGISGNRTCQLFDRLYKDGIEFQPDVISILIGINDIWHRYGDGRIETTDAQLALNYRSILERLRAQTNAMIVMITPWNYPDEGKSLTRLDYANAMKAVAEEQGIYLIDASIVEDTGVNMMSSNFRKQYCKNPDDVSHLNAEGMKLVMPNFDKLISACYTDFLSKQ